MQTSTLVYQRAPARVRVKHNGECWIWTVIRDGGISAAGTAASQYEAQKLAGRQLEEEERRDCASARD